MNIYRVYYDTTYKVTKTALQPVVAAFTDTFSEAITSAVEEGINNAVRKNPTVGFFNSLLGKK